MKCFSYSTISSFHKIVVLAGESTGSIDSVFRWSGAQWCWLATPSLNRIYFFYIERNGYAASNGGQHNPVYQRPAL